MTRREYVRQFGTRKYILGATVERWQARALVVVVGLLALGFDALANLLAWAVFGTSLSGR